MKILTMHAFYQVLGGEDISHRTETAYLRERGHDVHDLTVHNADLGDLSTPARIRATLSNPRTGEAARQAIARFQPDVAYCNNLFPGLSSSVIAACNDAHIPVVRVLRNYRITCAAGSLYRDGQHCDSCVGSSPLPGIIHGCYRGSRPTTAIATLARQRDLHRNRDTHWIAISQYVRDIAIRAGLDADHITVRPNLSQPPAPSAKTDGAGAGRDAAQASGTGAGAAQAGGAGAGAGAAQGSGTDAVTARPGGDHQPPTPTGGAPTILYVGRDTPEKGLPLLLDAFTTVRTHRPDAQLHIVGASRPHDTTPGVTWVGSVPHEQVAARMADATVLAVPSTWAEPFGRVVVEALAVGTPVVAAATGGLAELGGQSVDLFDPTSPAQLAERLLDALARPAAETAPLARARYDADFAPDRWYSITMDVLQRAAASR
ncbi:glycosyltransferase [Demequina zhanjiangensis]|uniref:Glycosyltransferase n=1 Tax=Demequina zhanjiangensis TaxID=3051659 RepID=A0ABT8FYZ9_9MICO|nr:glycosyltransferase [Demequina sp. SYSU T00b26]MDN4472038.1 glycosyltransferase [Demequina sp. SYSU T00b26]